MWCWWLFFWARNLLSLKLDKLYTFAIFHPALPSRQANVVLKRIKMVGGLLLLLQFTLQVAQGCKDNCLINHKKHEILFVLFAVD